MKQEFVDLGLPSGILWAKHNVKLANKKHFTHSQAIIIAKCLHCELPTNRNFKELISFCKWEWMKLFGKVTGYKVTGPNGKSIFLSSAGYYGTSLNDSGTEGYYWSITHFGSSDAYRLYFNSNNKYVSTGYCDFGRSIRLIKRKSV